MKKSWLYILLAVLAGLFVFRLVALFESSRLEGAMQTQLTGKSAELDRQLRQLAVIPRLLSENQVVKNALVEQSEVTVLAANRALATANSASKSSFAFVLDLEGTTVASSNFQDEISFVGVNYGFRPYFIEALNASEASFFAVGATTGQPGYFVARAVMQQDKSVGVVVVKFELDGLLDSWQLPPYEWLAVDELGVVILSTNKDYLYAPTRVLSEESITKIDQDRRYAAALSNRFELNNQNSSYIGEPEDRKFLAESKQISAENWRLYLLVERSRFWASTFLYFIAIFSAALIAWLMYRNMQSQKTLVEAEKRYAHELEIEIQQRTDELHSAQQSLITESNYAMLGRMSGAINHEINQPLASLRLNLASLRHLTDAPVPDMKEIKQIVVESDRTTKRIGRVIATLRGLTVQKRAQSGSVSVPKVIAEVTETIKRERPGVYSILSVSEADSLPAVYGNDVLLQQAILNLLYNAYDAVLDELTPNISLITRHNAAFLEIEVSDNGCGVSDAVVENLFKPFITDTERKSGLGLGLTLVELIAKDFGGTIKYRPAFKDAEKGSIFTLEIPFKEKVEANDRRGPT